MTDQPDRDDSTESVSASEDVARGANDHTSVLRRIVRRLVRFYYPRIEISGSERIPGNGPVLLCANHANSLIDPVLIGWASQRPVRFLAKAPLFKTPVLGPVMQSLGMIPAFRGSDDKRQVRRNMESLDVGSRALAEGGAMGIFPEGKSHDAMALEMVRSGASRIAIQAAEQGAKGLVVVPIGINYQNKEQFRSSVWILVGEPIPIDEWLDQHDGESRAAMRALTTELDVRLRQVVIHLDELDWEPWVGELECMLKHNTVLNSNQRTPLQRRMRIADALNHFLTSDRGQVDAMAQKITSFRTTAEAVGLKASDRVFSASGVGLIAGLALDVLGLVLFLGPALLGTVFHLLPFVVTRAISRKIRTPGRTTVSMYRLAVGVPIYIAWYALSAGWLLSSQSPWAVLAACLLMPFAGMIALEYWRRAGGICRSVWAQVRVGFRRSRLQELRESHSDISGKLAELADRYDQALESQQTSGPE